MNYQELAKRTLNGDPNHTALERLANMTWGLAGEVAELYQALMVNPFGAPNLLDEAGDIRWYIAGIHSCLGFDELDTAPEEFPNDLGQMYRTLEPVFIALFVHISTLQELAKKRYFHKKPIEDEQFKARLRHIRTFYGVILWGLNLDIAEVEAANIAKLEKRYPTGFNTADSLARRDVTQ
jgi:hypothetical protein